MRCDENPNWFANSPLIRLNFEKDQAAAINARKQDPAALLLPLWRGDPLIVDGEPAFLAAAALDVLPADAPVIFLGESKPGKTGAAPYFAVDLSRLADTAAAAPFAEIGAYTALRAAAGSLNKNDLAIIGHARWLFEWHRKHPFCAACGGATAMISGGAKRRCHDCEAEHFPRSDPVAIVLAVDGDACLLGRGPHFPPGFLSALAGFIEAAETPEEAARRELFEEAGVRLTDIRYQFSQPWPFPCSLMMGFIADVESRDLNLDREEIEEARWIERSAINRLLAGEAVDGVHLPPKFTIARQLIELWSREG